MTRPTAVQPAPDAARQHLHRSGDLRRRAGADLRADLVLRRRRADLPAPGTFRTVPSDARACSSSAGATGRCVRSSTSAATAAAQLCIEETGTVRRNLQCRYHAWTYDLDRQAGRRAESHVDAGHRPRRVRPERRASAGVARLRVAVPGRRAAVVRGRPCSGASSSGWATSPPSTPGPGRGSRARPPHHLRRGGQLEADRRELHGVLPLRDHPPRAHGGAAGVRRRLRRAVLRRATARSSARRSAGLHRRRQRGLRPPPRRGRRAGPPLLRDHHPAAGVHQPGARPRDHPPDDPARRRPHDRRVRLAVRPRSSHGGRDALRRALPPRQRAGLRRLRTHASPRCPAGPTGTAGCWCPASTTSGEFHEWVSARLDR